MYEHYNLDPNVVSEELVKFEKLDELKTLMFPICCRNQMRNTNGKVKKTNNLPHFGNEDDVEETKKEAGRNERKSAELFILTGFLKHTVNANVNIQSPRSE